MVVLHVRPLVRSHTYACVGGGVLPLQEVSVPEAVIVPMHGPCPAVPLVVWMHCEPASPPSDENPPPRHEAPPPGAGAQSFSNWHDPPGCTLPLPPPELDMELEKTLLQAGRLIDMFEQNPGCLEACVAASRHACPALGLYPWPNADRNAAHDEVFVPSPASAQQGANSEQYCCAKPCSVEALLLDELHATIVASAASAARTGRRTDMGDLQSEGTVRW